MCEKFSILFVKSTNWRNLALDGKDKAISVTGREGL
jgi:hypothetical protein